MHFATAKPATLHLTLYEKDSWNLTDALLDLVPGDAAHQSACSFRAARYGARPSTAIQGMVFWTLSTRFFFLPLPRRSYL